MTGPDQDRARLDEMLALCRRGYWMALHIAASPQAAEDAVQESCLKVLERPRSSWPAGEALRPWFLGLVADRARKGLRSEARPPWRARWLPLVPQSRIAHPVPAGTRSAGASTLLRGPGGRYR